MNKLRSGCLLAQLLHCLTLCDSMNCSPPGSFVRGVSRHDYWSGLPCPPHRQVSAHQLFYVYKQTQKRPEEWFRDLGIEGKILFYSSQDGQKIRKTAYYKKFLNVYIVIYFFFLLRLLMKYLLYLLFSCFFPQTAINISVLKIHFYLKYLIKLFK